MNKKELLKAMAEYTCNANEECEKCPYLVMYDNYVNERIPLCMSSLAIDALEQLEQKGARNETIS